MLDFIDNVFRENNNKITKKIDGGVIPFFETKEEFSKWLEDENNEGILESIENECEDYDYCCDFAEQRYYIFNIGFDKQIGEYITGLCDMGDGLQPVFRTYITPSVEEKYDFLLSNGYIKEGRGILLRDYGWINGHRFIFFNGYLFEEGNIEEQGFESWKTLLGKHEGLTTCFGLLPLEFNDNTAFKVTRLS